MSEKMNQHDTSLEELFNEIQQESQQREEQIPEEEEQRTPKIDVLNLPPRKEIHGNSNKRINFKISKPLWRLLFVCILLLIILGGIYFQWGEDLEVFINNY